MCNILILEPGVMPIKEKFQNMVYNNWNSFGLVTKTKKSLNIVRGIADPITKICDPEEIWKLLERNLGYQRFLHCRFSTTGDDSIENAHPFESYKDENGNHILFMHNGTLHSYTDRKSGTSDSFNFNKNILSNLLDGVDYGIGKGRLAPKFTNLIDNLFPANNRGLLISQNDDYFLLNKNEWVVVEGENKEDIISANDTYFDKISRGPKHVTKPPEPFVYHGYRNNKVTSYSPSQTWGNSEHHEPNPPKVNGTSLVVHNIKPKEKELTWEKDRIILPKDLKKELLEYFDGLSDDEVISPYDLSALALCGMKEIKDILSSDQRDKLLSETLRILYEFIHGEKDV